MPLIKTIIPPSAFELIRDRIGEILIDEISNQAALTLDSDLTVNIFIERSNQLDITDLPAINISISDGQFSNKNYSGSVTGAYAYDIDIYTAKKTNDQISGDVRASFQLQKIIRICRSILDNPIYKTLGFVSPKINRVYCSDFNIAIPGSGSGKLDTQNSMMSRLKFFVESNEQTALIIPTLITGYETQVKINNTEKGYYFY